MALRLAAVICALAVVPSAGLKLALRSESSQQEVSNSAQVPVEATDCDINVYFLVDTSGSIGNDGLQRAFVTVLRALLQESLRRGARVVVSHFANNAATLREFRTGLRTNSADASSFAARGASNLNALMNTGGGTCLVCGIGEVVARKAEHPNSEGKRNLIFVLTDGVPNIAKNGALRSSVYAAMDRSGFPSLFSDDLTDMQFVLFGAAASPGASFVLGPYLDRYDKVTMTKVPSVTSASVDRATRELLKLLENGGCVDPEWATIYFANDVDTIYNYAEDVPEIADKYRQFWYARGGDDIFSPESDAQFYIAGFASLRGSPSYNRGLAQRRVKSATCTLVHFLMVQDQLQNLDSWKFTLNLGSFGDGYAGQRKDASLEAQKADRKVHIYFGKDFIMDFAAFKRGMMDTIVCDSETYRTPGNECSEEVFERCFRNPETADAWRSDLYKAPKDHPGVESPEVDEEEEEEDEY